MTDNDGGGNNGLYFIVGGLVVVVAVGLFFYFGRSQAPGVVAVPTAAPVTANAPDSHTVERSTTTTHTEGESRQGEPETKDTTTTNVERSTTPAAPR